MLDGLYYITDSDPDGRYLATVDAALRGGVRIVQYRSKRADRASRRAAIERLLPLCRQAGALLIVNDDPELAAELPVDGVHLGQQDLPPAEARRLLGPGKLLGVSAHTRDQAQAAVAGGADHLGVGSIFPTGSKADAIHIGLEALAEIRAAVQVPIVAIGGISRDLAPAVLEAGADSIAVISAIAGDPAPEIAARELSLLFNRRCPPPRGRVLTVAGSDSGGGAGIQADLKTITLLGGYGMSALTALTAQNTLGVHGIHPCPTEFVARQIDVVLDDIGADVIKTGMLFSADIVRLVAGQLRHRGLLAVVDPVMIAKGGSPLLQQEAIEAVKNELLPVTYLLTPNLPEAEALAGLTIRAEADMAIAAQRLQELGARNVLIKGGHLAGEALDLLLSGKELHRFPAKRVVTRNTHGTGCSYAAAIAALLAQGEPLPRAVARAKTFINAAIRQAPDLGQGHGPINHWQGAKSIE